MQTAWRPLAPVRRALLVSTVLSAGISVLMLALPLFALQILEAVVPTGSLGLLAQIGVVATILVLLALVLDMCREVVLVRAGLWLDHYLGQEQIEIGVALGLAGDVARQRRQALTTMRDALVGGRLTAVTDLPWALLGCSVIAAIHPMLGAVCIAVLLSAGAIAALTAAFAGRADIRAGLHQLSVDSWCEDIRLAVDAGISPQVSRGAMAHFEIRNRAVVSNAYSAGIRYALLRTSMRAFVVMGVAMVLAAGAWLAIDNAISPGAAMAAALISYRGLVSLEQTTRDWHEVSKVRRAWQSLHVDHEGDVIKRRSLDPGRAKFGGRIILDKVDACHGQSSRPALTQISLVIEPGAALGIIGPPGSGKSTLAAIIAGQIEPKTGRAQIDGVDLYRAQRSSSGSVVGYLCDSPQLLAGSISDNITGFSNEATPEVIEVVARFAGVHGLFAALPDGYDTDVGPAGRNLNLRTRRAVGLVRALFGSPRVIVLDEPEAGLDEAGLVRLEGLLSQIRETGIGIVLATREPRLLRQMHAVAVLDGGRLSEIVPAHRLPESGQRDRIDLSRQVA